MADVSEIGVDKREQLPLHDWRVAVTAELVAGDREVLGKAVVLSPNLAVTTSETATAARDRVAKRVWPTPPSGFGPLGLLWTQLGSTFPLATTIEAVDEDLRFAVLTFSGSIPPRDLTNILGTGELPVDGSKCSVVYADDPTKAFFQISGQIENRPGEATFYLYVATVPADASQLMGAPVFFEHRVVGMVVGGPSRAVSGAFILGVLSIRGMALSKVSGAVRARLPALPDELGATSAGTGQRVVGQKSSQPIAQNANAPAVVGVPNEPSKPHVVEPFVEVEQKDPQLWQRLSPSTRGALERAEGMRVAMGLKEVHMEQLIVGLFEKYGGPTQRLLNDAKIDEPELLKIIHEVRDTEIPTSYSPVTLNAFPPFSEHANKAMQAAVRRSAELQTKLIRSRHLLYGALSVEECGLVKALQDRGVRKENIPTAVPDDGAPEKTSPTVSTAVQAVEVFYSYSQTDVRFRKTLEKYLGILQQEGLVRSWRSRSIAGREWAGQIDEYVNSAQIILLLVSPEYFSSGYCNDVEVKRAVERHNKGEARVIPVILQPTGWSEADFPFSGFPMLPADGTAVSDWPNYDAGFRNVAEGIRKVVSEIAATMSAPATPSSTETNAAPSPAVATLPSLNAGPTPKVDSDLWCEEDRLGYEAYARTIAALITHKETVPPLTIGIKAPWGAGKTSLMKRVQHLLDGDAPLTERNEASFKQMWQQSTMTFWNLLGTLNRKTIIVDRERHDPSLDEAGGRVRELLKEAVVVDAVKPKASQEGKAYGIGPRITVWFNAWRYQTSEQVWAGMAHCMISQIMARMNSKQRELFWLRLRARRINADEVRWRVWETVIRQLLPFTLLIMAGCGVLIGAALLVAVLLPVWIDPKTLLKIRRAIPIAGILAVAWKAGAKLGEKAAGGVRDLVREPDYEDKSGYLAHVESDIRDVLKLASVTSKQPLVVFVDDLDRCAPNKVAEVVEAINLFLCGDYPNCIFVLGMEPGMVAAALEVANKDVIEKALEMGVADRTAPVGWRFMEKIVQLPIMIPPPTTSGRESYVKSLVGSVAAVAPGGAEAIKEVPREVPKEAPKEEEIEEFIRLMEGGTLAEVEKKSLDVVAQAPVEKQRAAAEAGKRVYARTFTERDPVIAEFVKEVAELVDGNPRQIKRYVNVFRFYSTLRFGLQADGKATASELPSDKVLAKFVALSIQWPHAMDCLRVKNCLGADGKVVSRLSYLEAESAKIKADDTAGDESWKKIIDGMGAGVGTWAQARTFRSFLSKGESLGRSGGHGLW